MASASLPFVIQDSLDRLLAFLTSPAVAFGRSGDRKRAMRSDRCDNIVKVVRVMLLGCSLQHDGLICRITRFWARPMSIPEIARLAGMTAITVARCIADLVDLELLESGQIKRKSLKTGQLEVSVGLRNFTDKFWESMGLLEKFKAAKEWAKKNGRRKLVLPFKSISRKVKETFAKAGDLIGSVFKNLDVEALKVKANCAEIQKLFRPRK